MAERRRKFEPEFREGAVRIVTETGTSIAEVAKDLGIYETTPANWVSRARQTGAALAGGGDEAERLRRENAQLKRDDNRSVLPVPWSADRPAASVFPLGLKATQVA
ncbi:transposase [Streptomyces sp. NBC_00019]|uniref:transposase n=1 Tax=Streptomyces sp. NBC_00019 TaxID=2975623 RepID=UPI00325575CD